jgi:hypothetical protein
MYAHDSELDWQLLWSFRQARMDLKPSLNDVSCRCLGSFCMISLQCNTQHPSYGILRLGMKGTVPVPANDEKALRRDDLEECCGLLQCPLVVYGVRSREVDASSDVCTFWRHKHQIRNPIYIGVGISLVAVSCTKQKGLLAGPRSVYQVTVYMLEMAAGSVNKAQSASSSQLNMKLHETPRLALFLIGWAWPCQ